jgi:hypothetical protein
MQNGPLRLRSRRAARAGHHSSRWRLFLVGGVLALVVGAVYLVPRASSTLGLGPGLAAEADLGTAAQPIAAAATTVATQIPRGGLAVAATATVPPRPTLVPTPEPTVVPSITATGRALLDGVRTDRAAIWVRNHTETPLRSGPDDDASVFTQLPQFSLLKQVEGRPNWLLVEYGGDGDTRQAGPGWVRTSDVGAVGTPIVWLRTARAGTLWSAFDQSARRLGDLPAATMMEVLGGDAIQDTRIRVRLPGDGRSVPPSQGWVDADALARSRTPSVFEVPYAYPESLAADIRLQVPYRTQLDGSDYESANCGPTVLGMALEAFGLNLPQPDLRRQVLTTEEMDPTDTDAGSYIWALATVAQTHGLRTAGLYEADGSSLHRWSLDEVRASVRAGQPVIAQVMYRQLPGREGSGYWGDHYIIITGLLGDDFLYNDPIGGQVAHEIPGYDRLISPTALTRAMTDSVAPYQNTAFSLSRG